MHVHAKNCVCMHVCSSDILCSQVTTKSHLFHSGTCRSVRTLCSGITWLPSRHLWPAFFLGLLLYFILKHQPLPSLLLGGVGMSWWMGSDSMWPKTLLFDVKLFHQWGLLPISPCSSSNESQLPSAHWPGHVTQQLYTAVSRMLLILRLILIWHPTTTNNAPELTERKMNSTCFLLFDFIFINRNIIKSDFKHHHANKHVFTQFHCFIFS